MRSCPVLKFNVPLKDILRLRDPTLMLRRVRSHNLGNECLRESETIQQTNQPHYLVCKGNPTADYGITVRIGDSDAVEVVREGQLVRGIVLPRSSSLVSIWFTERSSKGKNRPIRIVIKLNYDLL